MPKALRLVALASYLTWLAEWTALMAGVAAVWVAGDAAPTWTWPALYAGAALVLIHTPIAILGGQAALDAELADAAQRRQARRDARRSARPAPTAAKPPARIAAHDAPIAVPAAACGTRNRARRT